jgi:hypothetical protein
VLPLFQLMGKNITLVGGNGDGQTTKVANQIIVALNIEAVAEALVFASKAGADPAKVRQALMGGFAASRILEVHGERMIKRSFNPGFRIQLHQKDLNLALQGAKALGVSLPGTANVAQLMQACAAHGLQDQDHSAVVRALELLARGLNRDDGDAARYRRLVSLAMERCAARNNGQCGAKGFRSRPFADFRRLECGSWVARQRHARAGCGASPRRSVLRTDSPAMLGLAAPSPNSLRDLRSLRSDSVDESDHEARCARGHEPCASRHLRGAPTPARARLC